MASKRGRPISTDSLDLAEARRRQAQREGMRRVRAQQREVYRQPYNIPQRSVGQLQQGEQVVDLAITEQEEAPITLTQLGLRVQGITLAQDPYDAQLRQVAVPSDDHEIQYADDDDIQPPRPPESPTPQRSLAATSSAQPSLGFFRQFARPQPRSLAISSHIPSPTRSSSLSGQQRMSQYFTTLPARSKRGERYEQEQGPSVTQRENRDRLPTTLPPPEGYRNERASPNNTIIGGSLDLSPIQASADEISAIGEQAPADRESQVDCESTADGGPSDEWESIVESEANRQPLDDRESIVEFASEHSGHEDSEDETEPPSSLEVIVEKLYDQLIGGHHGCTAEEHDIKMAEHMRTAEGDHHSLDEIFNDDSFPSVIELGSMLSRERLEAQHTPTPRQWKEMFCGTSHRGQRRLPKNVCLHKEETRAVAPQVAFDVDSFLGFATSLAIARKGLWYQPVSIKVQNIVADNHLEIGVPVGIGDDQGSRQQQRMLRDVPHFLLGRVVGCHDITVHVLLPHLYTTGEKFVSLTSEQLARWVDQVYTPALHEFYDAHYTQHLPASYRHASANSKAHQVEGRLIKTSSYQAQQSIGYHLQPEHLDAIWSHILQTIETRPGLADFREPQLFFSAKGTKLQFKTGRSRPSLLDSMEHFLAFFEDVLNPEYVEPNRVYVDIGKEICPPDSLLPNQARNLEQQPQVYGWKRCCLESYMQWLYGDKMPGKGKAQTYFGLNMLYDSCSLTSVTPRKSQQREGGLIYSQFYASVKEITDATKCFPFSNDGMEEMALDPKIREAARNITGGSRRQGSVVTTAYLASKRRTRDALRDSRGKSFGIREEHRISWELFYALLELLRVLDQRQETLLDDCPPYAYAIKTSTYIDYLWRSADKFATGFEIVLAQCNPQLVTWEETKIMAMFLRCLRHVFGGHLLSRESPLWWSRRVRTVEGRDRVWYGLGFSNTLPRYGYCWLEPRVDWSRLRFKEQVTDNVLFGNNVLRGQYLHRGRQASEFMEITRQLDVALGWLKQHINDDRIRRRMLRWIIHICLWQFRLDVFAAVKPEILAAYHEAALYGLEGFSYEYFTEIMRQPVHLMAGNRCEFKLPTGLYSALFGQDDARLRRHWESKPYRMLFARAREGVGAYGRDVSRSFRLQFERSLYQYHWVLPYPHPDGLLQTTKQGQRMWYSIETDVQVSLADTKDWRWARKSWQVGRPQALPDWLTWQKDRWEAWIEGREQ